MRQKRAIHTTTTSVTRTDAVSQAVTPTADLVASHDDRVSLAPLDPEQALRALLATPPHKDDD